MKAKASGKKPQKKGTFVSIASTVSGQDERGLRKRLPTEQSESQSSPMKEIKQNQFKVNYRPFSPPFVNIQSESSELEDLIDADFVPSKNLDQP